MATFHGITRKHIGGRLGLHTESVELFKLDIEVELLVEEDEEVEEEGLVTVGWMEGRSREPFGPFDTDFLPLASHGWAASCSRLSLDRGSVSRQACRTNILDMGCFVSEVNCFSGLASTDHKTVVSIL